MSASESVLLNDLKVKLAGKLEGAVLQDVLLDIGDVLRYYEVTRKSTALTVYEGTPQCMKVFLVTKKIEGRSDGTLDLYKIGLDDMFDRIRKPVDEITANDLRLYLFDHGRIIFGLGLGFLLDLG